jgi:hypothetical protein
MSRLRAYLANYGFVDTSLNPLGDADGYGAHAMDIMGGLDVIEAAVRNGTYTNTFDFYEAIMVLLNELKEPHTTFIPPCVSKFVYMLPFYFEMEKNENS